MPTVLQVEVNDEFLTKLKVLARDTGRSVEELHQIALDEFVQHARQEVDEILESIQDIADGRTVPHDEVVAWLEAYGNTNAIPLPQFQRLTRAS